MVTEIINSIKHSPIYNYAGVPGLVSWMLKDNGPGGKVRMFEMTRHQTQLIVPRSHRFDLMSYVIKGIVTNRLWRHSPYKNFDDRDELFSIRKQLYLGEPGKYETREEDIDRFVVADITYNAGDHYHMSANDIHSVHFSKGAKLVICEGATLTDTTQILIPRVEDVDCDIFHNDPWMFMRME